VFEGRVCFKGVEVTEYVDRVLKLFVLLYSIDRFWFICLGAWNWLNCYFLWYVTNVSPIMVTFWAPERHMFIGHLKLILP